MSQPNMSASLALHGLGLIVIYSLYGVLQERIIRHGVYGPDSEKFESTSLLILCNRIFSVSTGIAILAYKSSRNPQHGAFSARLRPSNPLFAYCAVAVSNFLSTMCQYEALRYVSYTTQSLAKCSKMIPVLVVGALVYKKKNLPREWVAGAVIAVGCGTYLFSQPPRHSSHAVGAAEGDSGTNALMGTLFLTGYLFFDGLVSTTQEKVFGKNANSADPFGPESPVLDQMIWTNTFAGLLSLAVAVTDASGTLSTSLRLLFTSPALVWDVCVFSAASALGLILLLNTIASFGALTSSLIMTIRQFLSILINAGAFGNFGAVGLDGWCGVGWVASGIWIKMNRKWDEPKRSAGPENGSESIGLTSKEAYEAIGSPQPGVTPPKKGGKRQYIFQYALPCAVPVVAMILITPFVDPTATAELATGAKAAYSAAADRFGTAVTDVKGAADKWTGSSETAAPVNADEMITEPIEDDPSNPIVTSEDRVDGASASEMYEADAELEAEIESEQVVEDSSIGEEVLLTETELAEAEALSTGDSMDVAELAGGRWDSQLHSAVHPQCPKEYETRPYDGNSNLRTGFVSYPRSGNSYMRSLMERSTGFRTSSVYCDRSLEKTFHGECDHETNFFVKTHYGALASDRELDPSTYYKQFDQIVHVVRNPLDAIASWWQLNAARTTLSMSDPSRHAAKVANKVFGEADRSDMLRYIDRWDHHTQYWSAVPVHRHTLRYEDLKAQPVPNMMALLSFVMPEDDLPGLDRLACLGEKDEGHEAYKSRRSGDFSSWDDFEPGLRSDLLARVRRSFCAMGYDKLLVKARPEAADEMDGFCEVVEWDGKMVKRTK